MAIEGARPDGAPDCAIIVSMDLAFTSEEPHEGVRRRISGRFPEVTPGGV